MRRIFFGGTIAILIQLLTGVGFGQTTFSDNFNRPNSSAVGNGWSDTIGNSGGNLSIQNNQLTNALGTDAGIYRPFAFTGPTTVSATLLPTDDSVASGDRYEDHLTIDNNGNLLNGYGISIGRTGSDWNNSNVSLIDGTTTLAELPSTFQFGAQIDVQAAFQTDGSIVGNISEGTNSFNFTFGPRTVTDTGSNFSIVLGARDNRNSGPPSYPRLDNLSISTITTTATNQPAPTSVITLNTPSAAQLEVFNSTTGTFQMGGSVNPNLPTVVFTHGFSSSASQWNTLASEWPGAGLKVNLLAWDWSSDAGNILQPWTLGQATSRTQNEGAGLGDALVTTLGTGYNKDIQFVGHSLGTLVNAEAINVFNTHTGDSAKTQDTLFDDAEIANLVAGNPLAGQWAGDVPASSHVAWIDNYVSAFGDLVNQSNAVNVILRQSTDTVLGPYGDVYTFHGYPQTWYQSTLPQNNAVSFGYPWSIDQGNLTVADVPVGQYFSQDLYPANPLSLQSIDQTQAEGEIVARGVAESPQILAVGAYFIGGNVLNSTIKTSGQVLTTLTNEAATALAGPSLALKFLLGNSVTSPSNLLANSAHPAASLIAPTPSYVELPISIPQNVEMMSFNFQFNGLDPNDYLAVGINDTQIFALEANFVPDGVLQNSELLDVSQWAGQDVQMLIYDSGIASAGTIDVQDIEFFTIPEPKGIALILLFLFGVCSRRIRPRPFIQVE